jgi:hypothetical protein
MDSSCFKEFDRLSLLVRMIFLSKQGRSCLGILFAIGAPSVCRRGSNGQSGAQFCRARAQRRGADAAWHRGARRFPGLVPQSLAASPGAAEALDLSIGEAGGRLFAARWGRNGCSPGDRHFNLGQLYGSRAVRNGRWQAPCVPRQKTSTSDLSPVSPPTRGVAAIGRNRTS